jgi:branched-chain amino acid transport system substrate-binding protein
MKIGSVAALIGLAISFASLTCFGHAAEPLKIGMVTTLTGPAAEYGRYETQGAKLAAEEVNKAGGVLGRPIELVIEDNQSTNPGSVLAFSKLAGDKDIPGFIGPVFSTQIHAMAPDIQRLGKPVMIGGTDPQLTHMGNPWLFRFRPNDTYSARVIADYGVKTLDKKKWAIVHTTDAFGTSGMKNLVEALKGIGVEPALVQGYANNSQDFTPVVLAVKQSGADVMGTYMGFPADQAIFARQLRQLGVNIAWVGFSHDSGDERPGACWAGALWLLCCRRFRRRLKPGSQGVRYEIRGNLQVCPRFPWGMDLRRCSCSGARDQQR